MCTPEMPLPSMTFDFEASSIVSQMLALHHKPEEDENTGGASSQKEVLSPNGGVSGRNGERMSRGPGIHPMTAKILGGSLPHMDSPLSGNRLDSEESKKRNGNTLLAKIKVKPVPEPVDENSAEPQGDNKPAPADGSNQTCRTCNRTFLRKCDYNKHMRSHAGVRPYACHVCGQKFTRSNHVYRHLNVHNTENAKRKLNLSKKLHPVKNGKQPAIAANQRKDTEAKNGDENSINGVQLDDAKSAILDLTLKENGSAHKCKQCGKHFTRWNALLRHVRSHLGIRPHMCSVCKKTFTNANDLKVHRRLHTGLRPYLCMQCGRSFTRSSHLKRHQRMHNGDRPYECKVCLKRFTNARNLNCHMEVHEKNSGAEPGGTMESPAYEGKPRELRDANTHHNRSPAKVPLCLPEDVPLDLSKSARNLSVPATAENKALEDSPLRLLPELSPTKSLRLNGRASSLSSSLRGRVRREVYETHGSHLCSLCFRSFPCAVDLIAHMESHGVSKPYGCAACALSFAEEEQLYLHVDAKHSVGS